MLMSTDFWQVSAFRIPPFKTNTCSDTYTATTSGSLKYYNTVHTYTLHNGVMVQNDDCDSTGLFVSLCLIKTWPQHGYRKGKKKTHLSFCKQSSIGCYQWRQKKKLITEDIFLNLFSWVNSFTSWKWWKWGKSLSQSGSGGVVELFRK